MILLYAANLTLFLTFLGSYMFKLVLLARRDRIQANVLGHGGKPLKTRVVELALKATTLIWGVLWFGLSAVQLAGYRSPLSQFAAPGWLGVLGVAAEAAGVTIFITAMIQMKSSWRVGIDKTTSTALITNGIYRYSRNPAFVGFNLMFTGLAFSYPGLLTVAVCLLNMLAIHQLIKQEELHLGTVFGGSYREYSGQTARYFGKKQ